MRTNNSLYKYVIMLVIHRTMPIWDHMMPDNMISYLWHVSYHPIIFVIINLLLIAMATQQELAMPDSDRSFSIVAFLM